MRKKTLLSFTGSFLPLIACLFTFLTAQSQTFSWVKQLGGISNDASYSIAVDGLGNVYTTGSFSGTIDFDPGPGTSNLTAESGDIFVTKFNAAGNFVWAKKMGGTSDDFGRSISVDVFGNVLISGSFQGTADFDPGASVFTLTSAGSWDIFISKLNAAGNLILIQDPALLTSLQIILMFSFLNLMPLANFYGQKKWAACFQMKVMI